MARRYDRIGAAFRWVYEDMIRVAPRGPDLDRIEEVGVPGAAGPSVRPVLALVAGLSVVVAVGAAALILGGEADGTGQDTTLPAQTNGPASTDSTSATATTAPVTTTGGGVLLRTAPWAAPPLASGGVDPLALEAWNGSGNRLWCSLLLPADPGDAVEEAQARKADFGSGAWAVSWDTGQGPGMRANSTPCENCGRSAFGIAGVDVVAAGSEPESWPNRVRWSDGSAGGFGNEGDASDESFVDPETGNQVPPRQLADIVVVGQACLYQVWSSLGPTHLESLLEQLRFVEDHQAEPVEVRGPGDPPAVTTDGGDPPWAQDKMPASDVPSALITEWRDSGAVTPLVAVTGLEADVPSATIRSAAIGAWGVAWDNPDGPGHDSTNRPCADCGRGVVGLGGSEGALPSSDVTPYGRVEWGDGSVATYDLYLGSRGLPVDRVAYNDPVSGEPVDDGWQAQVAIAGTDSVYTVWTHLGEEHLLDLLGRLRIVDVEP